jgi:hypothetical protein
VHCLLSWRDLFCCVYLFIYLFIFQNELKFHLVFEEPLMSSSEVLSVWASRHSMSDNHTLSIGETKFKVPSHLGSSSNAKISRPGSSIDDVIVGKAANEKCIQSHMTSFTLNPFGLEDRKKVLPLFVAQLHNAFLCFFFL